MPFFLLQTVNKVLLAYADIVRRDFEKYTGRQKVVSFLFLNQDVEWFEGYLTVSNLKFFVSKGENFPFYK